MISRSNATHYTWGGDCDGWLLLPRADVHILHERMPPGRFERRHHHVRVRQFFFVLAGTLTVERDGQRHELRVHEGLEIPPGTKHQVVNSSPDDVEFLVVSHPTSRDDRIDEP